MVEGKQQRNCSSVTICVGLDRDLLHSCHTAALCEVLIDVQTAGTPTQYALKPILWDILQCTIGMTQQQNQVCYKCSHWKSVFYCHL